MEMMIIYKDKEGLIQVLYKSEDKDLFRKLITSYDYEFYSRFEVDKKPEVEKEIRKLKENTIKYPKREVKNLVESLDLKILREGGLF